MTHELSMDARVLLSVYFAIGEKTTLRVGGKGAQSVLSDRADKAMHELVEGGYVTAKLYNSFGRMEYVGTEKCVGQRLSFKDMEEHGRWSATKPNPDLS